MLAVFNYCCGYGMSIWHFRKRASEPRPGRRGREQQPRPRAAAPPFVVPSELSSYPVKRMNISHFCILILYSS